MTDKDFEFKLPTGTFTRKQLIRWRNVDHNSQDRASPKWLYGMVLKEVPGGVRVWTMDIVNGDTFDPIVHHVSTALRDVEEVAGASGMDCLFVKIWNSVDDESALGGEEWGRKEMSLLDQLQPETLLDCVRDSSHLSEILISQAEEAGTEELRRSRRRRHYQVTVMATVTNEDWVESAQELLRFNVGHRPFGETGFLPALQEQLIQNIYAKILLTPQLLRSKYWDLIEKCRAGQAAKSMIESLKRDETAPLTHDLVVSDVLRLHEMSGEATWIMDPKYWEEEVWERLQHSFDEIQDIEHIVHLFLDHWDAPYFTHLVCGFITGASKGRQQEIARRLEAIYEGTELERKKRCEVWQTMTRRGSTNPNWHTDMQTLLPDFPWQSTITAV